MNAPLSSPAALRPADALSREPGNPLSSVSGVSWGAVLAGAAGAAALSLILIVLGMGLGLSSVSPWTSRGITATTFGVSTIAWLTFTQLAASGMGGYLASRLRTRWSGVHTDEVYFRDTAHGFLAWAVATLVTATMLASTIGSILNTGAEAGAAAAGGVVSTAATGAAAATGASSDATLPGASTGQGMGYFVDSLFRKDANQTSTPNTDASAHDATNAAASTATNGAPTAEVTRIFVNDLRAGALSPEDTRYVGQLVSQRTGQSQPDAEKRVTDTFAKVHTQLSNAETAARDAADKARKATAGAALWLFVSLLVGAFVASWAATYGGRRRDF